MGNPTKNTLTANKEYAKKFTFIAHWVEPWNWLLWWSDGLHKDSSHARYRKWLAPLYFSMSLKYLLGKKQYDVVDNFCFNGNIQGQSLLLRNFGWHFFIKKYREKIRQRILDAVLYAQEDGANVIGLGALTKAEWLTKGGAWIVDELADNLHIPVVHGDTLTAACIIMQAEEVVRKLQQKPVIFITGATSKIGRAVTIELARRDHHVVMFTKSRERFENIKMEAGDSDSNITHATSLSEGRNCNLWITGKAVPGGAELLSQIPDGAALLNFSVPNPISPKHLKKGCAIFSQEAGLLAYDPSITDMKCKMRLKPGITYACHAGTIVHAAKGWTNHEVSHVDLENIWKVWQAALDEGFFLPPFEF